MLDVSIIGSRVRLLEETLSKQLVWKCKHRHCEENIAKKAVVYQCKCDILQIWMKK